MINGHNRLSGWARNDADDSLVTETLVTLNEIYPGHPWDVFVDGGVLQVRNLDFSGNWGMLLKLADIQHDALARKKKLIMAAGEFLERANLRRGKAEDVATPNVVEGIPQKWIRNWQVRYGT